MIDAAARHYQRVQEAVARGALDDASRQLTSLLARFPDDRNLLDLMGVVSMRLGQHERGLFYFAKGAAANPDDIPLQRQHAKALVIVKRANEGMAVLRRVLDRFPDEAGVRAELVMLMIDAQHLGPALTLCEAGLDREKPQTELAIAYAHVLHRQGRTDEAVDWLRTGLRELRGVRAPLETLAVMLNYAPSATPAEQLAAHSNFGRLIDDYNIFKAIAHPATDDPERRLKVAVLSPDLRTHSVAYFVEPLLEHLDRSRFHVTCYQTHTRIDQTTDRLRHKSDAFIVAVEAGPGALAARIAADKIDILIELSGLLMGHNLATMQIRPAPVQVTYLGYPNTTGVRTIDYRIVDSLTDPPGAERFAVEKLARIDPCFLCYRASPEGVAIEPSPPARSPDEPIVFGCFNDAMKMNDVVLRTWARLLDASPGSRLLIKAGGMEHDEPRAQMAARMEHAGLGADRVELRGRVHDAGEHLRMYHRVDIALDTFPYNGTTTTCEALLMGVPVVSLAGQTHASRVGLSLLTQVGQAELVATDMDGYVRIAAALAADRPRLAALKARCRSALILGPLCDGAAFGQRFGLALREMWRARCAPKG